MRYSTVPAIDLEAYVARNRELITKLPAQPANTITWNPATLSYDVDTKGVTTYGTTPNGNN